MNADHQDVKDIASAREGADIEISRIRDFVYGKLLDSWVCLCLILIIKVAATSGSNIASSSISCQTIPYSISRTGNGLTARLVSCSHFRLRLYMTRTERFTNGLKMTRRVHELCDVYSWSGHDFSKAIGLMDEPVPLTLHLQGGSSTLISLISFLDFNMFDSISACHVLSSHPGIPVEIRRPYRTPRFPRVRICIHVGICIRMHINQRNQLLSAN